MGSGEKACRDSTMVVELMQKFLEAGFQMEMAIQMINSLLLTGEENANMSTLDLCSMDLYSGECRFVKVGSACSYIKRGHLVDRISSGNLPLGIFQKPDVEAVGRCLEDGDYIVMISDGILDALSQGIGEDMLSELIGECDLENPGEMAGAILNFCIRQCKGHIRDDMTVLVTGIWKKETDAFFFAGFRYIKDMIGKIMDYIKEYEMIQENDVVIAGVSGGADSVCLLFVLLEIQKKMPFQIRVVHVDHGIRKEAGRDAAFVEQLCRENKLSFYLERADVPALSKSSGLSVEEEGRRVRYQAFEKALGKDTGKIAVAHNSNDRAETMLFHLFRGTGLRGMSGIRPVNGRVIRPLLCVSRQEIEAWLTQKGLSYCEDSTNSEDVYTRNRIRHHILPYAQQQICQGAVGNMNRAAQELFLANEFVERKTREALSECVREQAKDRICVQLPLFLKQDPYLKGRILLSLLSQLHGSQKT